MRLIDKDLILETAKDKEWGLWCEIVNIKFAPEVKAIPVEWIERKLAEHWYVDYDIRELLEDWEKENETNRQR